MVVVCWIVDIRVDDELMMRYLADKNVVELLRAGPGDGCPSLSLL
jgi:hypothetical protein